MRTLKTDPNIRDFPIECPATRYAGPTRSVDYTAVGRRPWVSLHTRAVEEPARPKLHFISLEKRLTLTTDDFKPVRYLHQQARRSAACLGPTYGLEADR